MTDKLPLTCPACGAAEESRSKVGALYECNSTRWPRGGGHTSKECITRERDCYRDAIEEALRLSGDVYVDHRGNPEDEMVAVLKKAIRIKPSEEG